MTGAEISALQFIAQVGGIGAVFAVILFVIKRADDKRYADELKALTAQVLEVVRENTKQSEATAQAMWAMRESAERAAQQDWEAIREELRRLQKVSDERKPGP